AWQDLANAQRYAVNLRDAMARARPAFAAEIGQRCASYIERLQALDRDVRARFDAVPRQHRRVISSHDAFGYFGAAYGIEFLAPQGMNTDSEPSAASVARLIDQIRRADVRAVFVENISDPRLVQRIAREGGAVIGGRLYSDALSAPGTEADTYLKLFAHNATTIASALSAKR
ncbi:MAG TPA: zinc ABC transporter substrate-binding protein, partial [Variovorax sp.]|nr:zinc ABC transporter substrate-binding protein [Variovorax sp.]